MTNSKSIGVGIIGTGLSAMQHTTALREVPSVRIVAVAGTSVEKGRCFAERWAIPRGYGSAQQLITDAEVAAIHVCTPPDQRLALVDAAARAGKHLLVEKPLARTVAETDRIIALTEEAGIILGTMAQYRLNPLPLSVKTAVDSGKLGRLLLVDAQTKWYRTESYYRDRPWRGTASREGGGVLLNQAIHTIDLVRWIAGPVAEVYGLTATTLQPIEMEDVGVAALRFANGAIGSLVATTVAYPGFPEQLAFHGEMGSAVLFQGAAAIEWHLRGEKPYREVAAAQISSASSDPAGMPPSGHVAEFRDFYAAVQEHRRPSIDGRDGRETLAVIEAIYQSAEVGHPVHLESVHMRPGTYGR